MLCTTTTTLQKSRNLTKYPCESFREVGSQMASYLMEPGDVVAQLVERRPRDPMDAMDRGSNPVRSTIKNL